MTRRKPTPAPVQAPAQPSADSSVHRQFTPAGLAHARRGVDLAACGLVAVDDPAEWELYAEHKGGGRHSWRHIATGWVSQTLSVPREEIERVRGSR